MLKGQERKNCPGMTIKRPTCQKLYIDVVWIDKVGICDRRSMDLNAPWLPPRCLSNVWIHSSLIIWQVKRHEPSRSRRVYPPHAWGNEGEQAVQRMLTRDEYAQQILLATGEVMQFDVLHINRRCGGRATGITQKGVKVQRRTDKSRWEETTWRIQSGGVKHVSRR